MSPYAFSFLYSSLVFVFSDVKMMKMFYWYEYATIVTDIAPIVSSCIVGTQKLRSFLAPSNLLSKTS